jgi:hypothetical protein
MYVTLIIECLLGNKNKKTGNNMDGYILDRCMTKENFVF